MSKPTQSTTSSPGYICVEPRPAGQRRVRHVHHHGHQVVHAAGAQPLDDVPEHRGVVAGGVARAGLGRTSSSGSWCTVKKNCSGYVVRMCLASRSRKRSVLRVAAGDPRPARAGRLPVEEQDARPPGLAGQRLLLLGGEDAVGAPVVRVEDRLRAARSCVSNSRSATRPRRSVCAPGATPHSTPQVGTSLAPDGCSRFAGCAAGPRAGRTGRVASGARAPSGRRRRGPAPGRCRPARPGPGLGVLGGPGTRRPWTGGPGRRSCTAVVYAAQAGPADGEPDDDHGQGGDDGSGQDDMAAMHAAAIPLDVSVVRLSEGRVFGAIQRESHYPVRVTPDGCRPGQHVPRLGVRSRPAPAVLRNCCACLLVGDCDERVGPARRGAA